MADPRLVPIARADIRFGQRDWPFARAHAAEIEAHWRRRTAEQPRLYNGGILLLGAWSLENGAFMGECFETDFKSFLYWRDHGAPDRSVADLFAAAALHSREGWLIAGRMGAHTANGGRIYPPCGSLHPDDVRAGRIDLDGSLLREVAEETGFMPSDPPAPPVLIFDDWRFAYLRRIVLPHPAAEIVARIERFLDRQEEPELAEILLVKGPEDIDEAAMPPFTAAYVRHAFARGP